MIYLNCEVKSGLGEDTFWTWFEREFPNCSFDVPERLREDDILLRYSTLGFLPVEGKQIALCWELYPEMKRCFDVDYWDKRIEKIYECARYSTYRTVATEFSVPDYNKYGTVDIIPIGVNTELYKPLKNKKELRKEYNISFDKKVGVWIGTNHPMKGYEELLKYASNNPEMGWIIIWKWEAEASKLDGDGIQNFVKIPQRQICELINCADFFLATSKLKPYYMAEWEAMACNIPFVIVGNEREFIPSENPRDDVLERGWDRDSVKKLWETYLKDRGVKW